MALDEWEGAATYEGAAEVAVLEGDGEFACPYFDYVSVGGKGKGAYFDMSVCSRIMLRRMEGRSMRAETQN